MATEIPRYQSATPLGGESVIGFSGDVETHINWSAQASDDPPETVLAFYEQQLGEANERKGQQEALWRFPSEQPERVLHVLPIQTQGPHHQFKVKWPPSAQTAIIVSDISRRPPEK